ncbi:DUF3558 domain-containing protein [Nocardia takedensis]
MRYRVELGVFAAMIVPGLVACGDQGLGGGDRSMVMSRPWNPCAAISEEVLRAAGLVPATEDSGIPRPLESGREICRWDAPEYSYSVTVFSTTETVTAVERRSRHVDVTDVMISGRTGRQFKIAGDSEHLNCTVAFAAEHGSVRIQVFLDPARHEDPCQRVDLVGRTLAPILPR